MKCEITGSYEKLTASAIDNAEKELGRSIPADYRQFLLQHNGGRPDPSDFLMDGARTGTSQEGTVKRFLAINPTEETLSLCYVIKTFRDRIPADLFPIARDPGGNFITECTEGPDAGKIYFWDHELESEEGDTPTRRNLYFIAENFTAFLDKLGEI